MADKQRRRKSLSIFRPSVFSLTPIDDGHPVSAPAPATTSTLKKKYGQSSSPSPTTPTTPAASNPADQRSSTLPLRSRTFQRASRPISVFGSLRSTHSLQEEGEKLSKTTSNDASINEEDYGCISVEDMTVLHHGEVQTSGGMFRKKSQYVVLTDTHIIRFRTQAKAAEVFPSCVPSAFGRDNSFRHSRLSSAGSYSEVAAVSVEQSSTLAINTIVAVYKLDDGRPYFTIEIALHDELIGPSTMSIQTNDPRDSDIWLSSIRAAINRAKLARTVPFSRKEVEYVARVVEYEGDYDRQHIKIFRVVKRASRTGTRASSDDLGKLVSNIFYLAIGLYKIHLIPLQKSSKPSSSTSLTDSTGSAYGLMTLSAVHIQEYDDAFQIDFRTPFAPSIHLYLASSSVNDFALCMRQATEYLRPKWVEQPYTWDVPQLLDDSLLPPAPSGFDDCLSFDHTLTAYCAAYRLNPANIRYAINHVCEDAPEFELLHPERKHSYSALELLAVLRAIRYNEAFHSISFRDIEIDSLHNVVDLYGSEHFIWSSKGGQKLHIEPKKENAWILVQELQMLVLKSRMLRRIDFSNCLAKKPPNIHSKGSGICEAILPLAEKQLTNVDWLTLNGLCLAEIDVDYLYTAAIEKSCHFRGLEVGRCGLNDNAIRIFLQGITTQGSTFESLVLSNNQARLDPGPLCSQLEHFSRLRRLDLSKTQFSSTPQALIPAEILLQWRLEELNLTGTRLNAPSIDALSTYLASGQAQSLSALFLDECNLTGFDVATLLMSTNPVRRSRSTMHLSVSRNRIQQGHGELVKAIEQSRTPTRLTMQLIEYNKEEDFGELIRALAQNKTLTYLDISKVALPVDASTSTCAFLGEMFERNDTLQELDLSGEQAHLEAMVIGKGLTDALAGLEKNRTMKVLHVENQNLGLAGAEALASVLEKNETLREIFCEGNEFNLHAFTTLVNAVEKNKTLLFMPDMSTDRAWSRRRVDREVKNIRANPGKRPKPGPMRGMKRMSSAISATRNFTPRFGDKQSSSSGLTEQDVNAAVNSLEEKWETEALRLQRYLRRNYNLLNGLPLAEEDEMEELDGRPTTAGSLITALKNAITDRTPTIEFDRQLGMAEEISASPESTTPSSEYEAGDGHTPSDDGDALMMGKGTRMEATAE